MNNTNNASGGIGFAGLLTLIFITMASICHRSTAPRSTVTHTRKMGGLDTMNEAEKFLKTFTYTRRVEFVNLEALGSALRTRRVFAKVSLRSMAKTLGYSAPFSDCERGNRSMSLTALQNYRTVLERANKRP